MADDYSQFFPTICAGLGLFLAGGVNVVLNRRSVAVRAGALLVAFGGAIGLAMSLDQPGATLGTALLLVVGLIPFVLLGYRPLVRTAAALVAAAGYPFARAGLLTTAGVAVVISSLVRYENADAQATAEATKDFETYGRVATVLTDRVQATTDRGTRVALSEPESVRDSTDLAAPEERLLHNPKFDAQIIRRGPPDDRANCHGWVFTGGQFRIASEDVDLILQDNGYAPTPDPQPGDLVVYRSGQDVAHTSLVRYVTRGQPVLVEGKWGDLGVFLHPVERSAYGEEFSYYRSPRAGHLLVGLDESVPVAGTAATE